MKGEELQYLVAWCIEAPAEQHRAYAPNIAPTPPGASIAEPMSGCNQGVHYYYCCHLVACTGPAPGPPTMWGSGALVFWTM